MTPYNKNLILEKFDKKLNDIIVNKANIDLSNLSDSAEKHFVNKNQITNCILEYPHNVKIESNPDVTNGYKINGFTATMPDGSSVTKTGNYTFTLVNNQIILFDKETGSLGGWEFTGCNYAATAPSSPVKNAFWWNSTTNKIQRYNGTSWFGNWSLPLGWKDSNGIMHDVNVAGFFGCCQFFLPGIKYLVPNGRNADGSLNNIECITNSVAKNVYTYQAPDYQGVLLYNNGTTIRYGRYYEGSEEPEILNAACWFDTENNLMKFCMDGTTWTVIKAARLITSITSAASTFTVTNMVVKDAFKAVDFNDFLKSQINHAADLSKLTELFSTNKLYSTVSISGNSGYRELFSDAAKKNRVLLEQWGLSKATTNPATITFSKAFSTTNYNISCTPFTNGNTSRNAYVRTLSTTNMVIDSYSQGGSLDHNNGNIFWSAIGV